VNDHQFGRVGDRVERVQHRILPPVPAGHDANRLRCRPQIRRRRCHELRRQRDDELVDLGMRHEQADAALERRLTLDGEQLLGYRPAEPLSAASGRDDG
jgi:hypothetical protein